MVLGVEKIPFSRWLPFLEQLSIENGGTSGSLGVESEPKVFKDAEQAYAPIICYEIINDGLVRESANRSGAIIAQTNSATFANTPESAQQLAITRIRAVEHSREILSVSTVGISAFIDNNGAVISRTPENLSTSISGDLKISSHQTLSDRLGGVAPLLVLLVSLIFAIGSRKRALR